MPSGKMLQIRKKILLTFVEMSAISIVLFGFSQFAFLLGLASLRFSRFSLWI